MPAELTELLEQARQRRVAHAMPPAAKTRPWFKAEKKADKPRAADIWIYDTIGPSWFEDSTDAKSFTATLAALDVDEINLHINSPGGDAFDGLAIYNALKDHPATVTSIVDGLAASAASFIAQAGATRRMNRGAQMMIHDASGIVIGNPADMAWMADMLGKVSDSIAGIYAARGGGTVDDWREAMGTETWYTADEAVEAGLADEAVTDEPAEPPVRNAWDLAVFNYAGRAAAPAPVMPRAENTVTTPEEPPAVTVVDPPVDPPADPAPEPVEQTPAPDEATGTEKEGAGMPIDPAKIREALGLASDASDDDVGSALAEAGLVKAAAKKDDDLIETSDDMVAVDPTIIRELQAKARRGDEAYAELQRQKRDTVLDQAVLDGKFGADRRAHWADAWDADPEGTEKRVAKLAPGLIPVDLMGYAAADHLMNDRTYAALYGSESAVSSRG